MPQALDTPRTKSHLDYLHEMRDFAGVRQTPGLTDAIIQDFLDSGYHQLAVAIERGYTRFLELRESHADFVALDESEQISLAHGGLTNFYAEDAVNPYVAVSASGPWVVSLKGAVIYDCGGYGMLGLGHVPEAILAAMNKPHVMANIMTASVSQVDFVAGLRREIGHTRSEGYAIMGLTLQGSFHGRTDRPARYSDSCARQYAKHLASYRDRDYLLKVEPNNIEALEKVFAEAFDDGIFIEAFFMEPVMGEGNPGMPIEPEFYARARELTREYGSLFVVDSIQAGLRAHGVLSIVDYPGFRDLDPPDMESYSKALNAGQYPLSVLALSESTAAMYKQGLYGNTMTTNPRALDVAIAVLHSFSEERRENIRVRGKQLVDGLLSLATQTDGGITHAQGTGLLASCELATRYKTYGSDSTEDYLRRHGLGVIHGGAHSLRYTPIFDITSKEVDLIVELTKNALLNGPTH